MNIVFRVDASPKLGAGHLMRCLTLADRLAWHGCTSHFLTRYDNDLSRRLLVNSRHAVLSLDPGDNETVKTDARQSIHQLKMLNSNVDWLVVDHYDLDASWELAVRPHTMSLLVIDDLANRTHICDLLVDPGMDRQAADYSPWLRQEAELMLGSTYAILNPSFARHHGQAPRWPEVRRAHVFFGGGAAAQWLPAYVELILALDPALEVCALGLCDQNAMNKLLQQYGDRLSWSRFEGDMVAHYLNCSVAVGSPGTATWERACLGLPSAIMATADNQIPILEKLDRLGLCRYLGPVWEAGAPHLISALQAFMNDASLRSLLRTTGMSSVDGRGAERVVTRMLAQF